MPAKQITAESGVRFPVAVPSTPASVSALCTSREEQYAELLERLMARSYNGYYAGLSNRSQEFDSPTSRQGMSLSSTNDIRALAFTRET